MEKLITYLEFAIGAVSFFLLVAWSMRSWHRQGLAHAGLPENDDSIDVGTAADLTKAENELREQSPMQELEQLLQTHVLLDRLSTLHGFTDTYMAELTLEFEKRGLHPHVIFRQTMPVGSIALVGASGIYEIYVPSDERAASEALMRERANRG